MDMKQIKQLVKLMIDNELTEVDIASGEDKIHLKRAGESRQVAPVTVLPRAAPAPAEAPCVAPKEPIEAEELVDIRSPMVGTFYAAPSPENDPYAEVGDSVDGDTAVCIVEAMKVMNEIKADCSGTIAEICVKNAQPVEYGQVLFRVKPASAE
ncbi:MAG: acetyl-CoA carboxylase biotin carboxyl carrier protein [Planctomycetota bacterium]|jgi:acetyl-CoA carboxylase biotin carboxyl carrier protein